MKPQHSHSQGKIHKSLPQGKDFLKLKHELFWDNHLFSLLTMNDNPLHTDANYMSDHKHGKILVNGLLVISLVVGMSVRQTSGKAIANLVYESVTHDGPTFHGDTIYAESEVLEVIASKTKEDQGLIYIESRGFNQRDEQVLTMRRKFLVKRRPK